MRRSGAPRPPVRAPRRRVVNHDAHAARERVKLRLSVHGQLGLASEVALAHDVAIVDLVGPNKADLKARAARNTLWKRMYQERFLSTTQIGRLFEVDDHTVGRVVRGA